MEHNFSILSTIKSENQPTKGILLKTKPFTEWSKIFKVDKFFASYKTK